MPPLIVRRALIPLHEWLLRRPTLSYLRRMEASQWWPPGRLREFQQARLRALAVHAHAHCPYYRALFEQSGIRPPDITLEQLARLPTIDKDVLARNARDFLAPDDARRARDASTGGSTGRPLHFKIDRYRQAADQAARARSRRWFGIELGDREAYLWGSPVEHAAQDWLKAVRDRCTNHRLFNAFRLTPRRMSQCLDALDRFDPVHLFGYPSSLALLARHAAATGRRLRNRSLRAVFVTGELLSPDDRAVIEEYFAVPVADGYGSREAGFLAHQCPEGAYHVTMESAIVEIVDPGGRTQPAGQLGEIVVTHLDARAMPFIRYRTGDLARRRPGPCACGRGLECIEGIVGRRTDLLRTVDGGHAHALAVIYVLREEPAVAEFKVIQRGDLSLDVALVSRSGASTVDAAVQDRLRTRLRRQIGGPIDVRITLTDRIPPDPSGKHRHVVRIDGPRGREGALSAVI